MRPGKGYRGNAALRPHSQQLSTEGNGSQGSSGKLFLKKGRTVAEAPLVSNTVLPAFRSTGGEGLPGSRFFGVFRLLHGTGARLAGGVPVQDSSFRADNANRSFMKKSGVKPVCSQQPSSPAPRTSGVSSPMIIWPA